jgi:DNA replicative helicase MCM subunit Mcm2 (Cdc46/Mcm family)
VKRGWGELLIIGDSGQAKTTIVERMMHHYRLGELHSGESSRRTGLVYNLQQNNKRWFLVWGAFPLNDGGLLTIDELSGLNEEDLAVMSDVRSSGIAKATGVITAETTSRTRAIYISKDKINFNKLLEYAKKFDSQAVIKRLGYLIEILEIKTAIIPELLKMKTTSYVVLDTELPKSGKRNSRWSIQQNLDIETIKSALYT